MKDFRFLFAAWICVWVVFFGYEVSIARRMGQVKKELEELKARLRNG